MDKSLKRNLNFIGEEAIKYIEKDSRITCIVVVSPNVEYGSYVGNYFLNQRLVIKRKIKIITESFCNPTRVDLDGSYILLVNECLESICSKEP